MKNGKKKKYGFKIVAWVSYVLFIVGSIGLVDRGRLLGDINRFAWMHSGLSILVGSVGFFGVWLVPYWLLVRRLDYIENVCIDAGLNVKQAFRKPKLYKWYEKYQFRPLIMIGLMTVMYPFWIMLTSGAFYTNFQNTWVMKNFFLVTVLFVAFFLEYIREILLLSRLTEHCKSFCRYAEDVKNRGKR